MKLCDSLRAEEKHEAILIAGPSISTLLKELSPMERALMGHAAKRPLMEDLELERSGGGEAGHERCVEELP